MELGVAIQGELVGQERGVGSGSGSLTEGSVKFRPEIWLE